MVFIKHCKEGYLIGFDNDDSPFFGDKSKALEFDVDTAVDLCFELDDHQDSMLRTVDIESN